MATHLFAMASGVAVALALAVWSESAVVTAVS